MLGVIETPLFNENLHGLDDKVHSLNKNSKVWIEKLHGLMKTSMV